MDTGKGREELRVFEGTSGLLAPGPIYWEKSDGKRVCLLKYGRPIYSDFIRKFKSLKYGDNTNHGILRGLKDGLESLKRSKKVPEKITARKRLLSLICENYRKEGRSSNIVDFVAAFEGEFYSLPKDREAKLLNISSGLFKRDMMLGALRVCYALLMGHLRYDFLKELYHVGFMVTSLLTEDGLSFRQLRSLEDYVCGKDKRYLGLYTKKIQSLATDGHIKHPYLRHLPALSFEEMGGGMTFLECLFIFTAGAVPIDTPENNRGDGERFLLMIEDSVHSDFASPRLKSFIKSLWSDFE